MSKVIFSLMLFILSLNAQHLRVWMNVGYQPFSMPKDGKTAGYEIDLLNELAKKLNFTYEIVDTKLESLEHMADSNLADMVVSSINVSEELKSVVEFSTPYYKNTSTVFLKRKNDESIKDLNETIKGKIVGAFKNRYQVGLLHKIPDIIVKELTVKKGIGAIIELKTAQVDVLALDRTLANIYTKKGRTVSGYSKNVVGFLDDLGLNDDIEVFYEDKFDSEGYAIVFGNSMKTELKDGINKAILDMYEDGTIKKLIKKYRLE
ncbi:substrate-binding periplasmic protein [Campylobacter geochelonis]|uniref:Amino acid ABC transporter, permease /substrate-binding lipoprotein n=1 Tax=Campylobacter geochelonis TaxID=1780362 RepID=A0A128EHI8_9BACT|nr:transporter substrate-binding domain-containing protein [Campylobacter geochelonis]QKF71948.1 amino acid ABC transporter, periplasmic amino acid-binding protein [Campylobacter geochelonis]CZE47189.1 amino acid ABC transporter%2C permease /substrate-binding lipoprotein [Campylobacter geochelonis]CZE47822.1 amino acid ABC transporter%2C permease /substrate-binding lipoprotein [Campylobacter geochelonis]CZE49973.1 amino acid ABC transporter%2C permease /substrate-binding lipoprotein [Campylobac